MRRILITGITGFVGRYLHTLFKEDNKIVYGIDRKKSNKKNIFSCDIRDKKILFEIINKIKPDTVFHLAAQSSVKKSWENPELTRQINVFGTKNLLDSIFEAGLDTRILIVSSGDIYGAVKEVPTTETTSPNPNNPYSKSKREVEKISLQYFKNFKLDVMISRTFSHTGPGQTPAFVCSGFAKQIAEIEKGKSKSIKVGNLDARRDFTDVRDIIRAYVLAIEKCKPGEIYNICSSKAVSIKYILDTLIKFSDAKIYVEKDLGRLRPEDVPVVLGGNTKFVKETGWEPKIPIENTLKDLLNYWRAKV